MRPTQTVTIPKKEYERLNRLQRQEQLRLPAENRIDAVIADLKAGRVRRVAYVL